MNSVLILNWRCPKNPLSGGAEKVTLEHIFRTHIKQLISSDSQSQDSSMVRFLLWDQQHQVCLGNQDAVIQ